MKTKIISVAMAVVLLFTVFAMTVGAIYMQVYHFGNITPDFSYDIYLNIDTTYHYYEMDGWVYNSNMKVRLQCTIVYTDGTFDQAFSNNNSNSNNAVVYYNTSKTVSYVDMEMHIYYGSTYIDTVQCVYPE